MTWRAQAACRGLDTSLFFPEPSESAKEAKAVCARCPVRAECLQSGLYETDGIWGGVAARTRKGYRAELPTPRSNRRNERIAKARQMRSEGETITSIATTLGVTVRAVHRYLESTNKKAA